MKKESILVRHMKLNTISLLATLVLGLSLISCNKEEPELIEPQITDDNVEITATSASFSWTVDWVGKRSSVVELSEHEDMSDSQFYGSEEEINTKFFSITANDLKHATKYYYRFWVWNQNYDNNRFVFEKKSFSTLSDLPIVRTLDVTNITMTSATCQGEVISDGGAGITERGICWDTEHNPSIAGNHTNNGSEIGIFTIELSELAVNETYYVRAYAQNEVGIAYGEEAYFTTGDAVLPTVNTIDITNISWTTAKCTGEVLYDGGASVTERGVCWSLNENPNLSNDHVDNGAGLGRFEVQITGLTAGKTYHVRAYAKNGKGTSYGEDKTFETLIVQKPVVTTTQVTNVSQNTATGGGNVTDDGGGNVIERGICWDTSANPTINGNHSNSGTGIGTYSIVMSDLLPGTTYHVRAYAENSAGISYGNDVTFNTSAGIPTVTTSQITNITSTSANGGGNVTNDGGSNVIERGVCWGTSANPTINGNHSSSGTGNGTYTVAITGLSPGTTYHVRAYAKNNAGIGYGSDIVFTTLAVAPTVTTSQPTNITSTIAMCGGTVTNDGGASVTSRGICWSTNHNPSTSNNHSNNGTGTGSFTHIITDLSPNTTYYVRAFATNNVGTSYGNEVSFTTTSPTSSPIGAISGLFSVASNKKVYFSMGNLQYQANTDTWRFAENQYDYVGQNNQYISPDFGGWIDIFGWGTSGFNGCNPWLASEASNPYPYGGNISNTNYDWGVYNPISNGGNTAGIWRTLTKSEWVYLFNIRPNASEKYSVACINGVNGVIILPDDYSIPVGISFTPHANNWSVNNYSYSEWSLLECFGAVFLPAAGKRHGTYVSEINTSGYYWSSTNNEGTPIDNEYTLYFTNNNLNASYLIGVTTACAVRLVQDN